MFSVDTKGGNRPIRMITRSKKGINGDPVDSLQFGKAFMLVYSLAD